MRTRVIGSLLVLLVTLGIVTGNRSGGVTRSQRELIRLYEILAKRFDAEELRTLYFHLGIDYDDLKGEGKLGKARELVAFLERHGRIGELVATGKQFRPDLAWDVGAAAIPSPSRVRTPNDYIN